MQTTSSLSLAAIAVLSGAMIPLQAGMNARLGQALGHPLWGTFASLLISLLVASLAAMAWRLQAPAIATAWHGPWWAWLGGAIGVFYITCALLIAPRLGASAFIAAVVAGQMIASLALDYFGVAGFAARPITPWRLVGATLVIAGVLFMQAHASQPPTDSHTPSKPRNLR